MVSKLALSIALLVVPSAVVNATPTVVIGDHFIFYGTASTSIPIYITGGDPLVGMGLILEISEGGIFQSTPGPFITSINTSTGTIWSGNQDSQGVFFRLARVIPRSAIRVAKVVQPPGRRSTAPPSKPRMASWCSAARQRPMGSSAPSRSAR